MAGLWSDRSEFGSYLMPSSLRDAFLSKNNIKVESISREVTFSSFPTDNKIYYAWYLYVGMPTSVYQASYTDAFTFYNPDDVYFVLLKDRGTALLDYPLVAKNIMLYSEIRGTTNNTPVQVPKSILFYGRTYRDSDICAGALVVSRDSKKIIGICQPVLDCRSYTTGFSSNMNGVASVVSPLSQIYQIGRINRDFVSAFNGFGDYYTIDVDPIGAQNVLIGHSIGYADSRAVWANDARFGSPWGNTSNVINSASVGLNNNIIRAMFPSYLEVESYDELSAILELTNEEIENKLQTVDLDSPYTPGIGGGKPSSTGGGGGNFGIDPSTGQPVQSDDITGSLPSTGSFEGSVSNAGLFVHYAMNASMLKVIGDWLWASDLGLIIAKEVLSILYGSPIESAISLISYPFSVTNLPGVVSNQQELYWGAHGAGFNATAITNPYATIDWGTIQLTEFWGNFLDYAPHTKLELYLPWCTGFVPIDPNECLPGSLRVVTNIELSKGTCLHNVIGNDGRVIATHMGTCGKQLPLTALDTSGKALALVSGAVGAGVVAAGAASGAAIGALDRGTTPVTFSNLANPANVRHGLMRNPVDFGNIVSEASTGANRMRRGAAPAIAAAAASFRNPISVQRSGTFSGSTAGLGVQYPYLIISRPTQSVPKQYGHHYGYPSNIYASLDSIRGYTEVGEIHLTGFTCTDDELGEIDSILKSGVIL